MRDYIEITGKTEEEAIKKGLQQLGLDRDEVSVEILERAKAGFLGFGSAPAKIRMSYGPDKPAPMPEAVPETSEAPAPEGRERKEAERSSLPLIDPAPERKERRERRRKREPRTEIETPAAPVADEPPVAVPVSASADEGPASERPAPRKARPNKRKASQKPKDAPEPKPASVAADAQAAPVSAEEVNDEKAQAIRAFLSGLLEHMDCKAEIRVYQPEESRYKVILEGAGMGALIGRRGETLDAIQQLTNYSVNRNGARVRIQLDAEGYREKREQSLQNLARKEAAKVVKYRRSRTLEPMNAYERHVIHTALQEFPGVNTYSTGVDPNRRVVIAFDRDNA